MPREYPGAKPRLYAKEKLEMLKERLSDATISEATTAMAKLAFSGAPPEAFHGFTAFTTSPTEDTFLPPAGNKFHEIGLYQVEAGTKTKPVPNTKTNAEYSNWALLANTPIVRQYLGRPATMQDGGWKTALKDQIAVGIANLAHHSGKMRKSLSERINKYGFGESLARQIAPAETGSVWAVLFAFTSFSRGEGQFFKVLVPYLEELAETAEETRWQKWRELIQADILSNAPGIGSTCGKSGAAYAVIRSEQKFHSGYLLARETGGEAKWFSAAYSDSAANDALEDCLTRTAYPN